LLDPLSTPKLEGHHFSSVRDCLFNIFAATLHFGGRLFHPHPEDASCRGDRKPFNMASSSFLSSLHPLKTASLFQEQIFSSALCSQNIMNILTLKLN